MPAMPASGPAWPAPAPAAPPLNDGGDPERDIELLVQADQPDRLLRAAGERQHPRRLERTGDLDVPQRHPQPVAGGLEHRLLASPVGEEAGAVPVGGQRGEFGEQRDEVGVVGVARLVSHDGHAREQEAEGGPLGKLPAARLAKTPALVGS